MGSQCPPVSLDYRKKRLHSDFGVLYTVLHLRAVTARSLLFPLYRFEGRPKGGLF
ncbi:MAG: hypothetical protein G01um101425_992 [Candidatus Peregrinibacteria bacterium Gr01-1014_25]|nr:MAG: hypothetical protein G01um101425_992 [Candidatus Peregrinibacteria bacterium Gr01-1014_25]